MWFYIVLANQNIPYFCTLKMRKKYFFPPIFFTLFSAPTIKWSGYIMLPCSVIPSFCHSFNIYFPIIISTTVANIWYRNLVPVGDVWELCLLNLDKIPDHYLNNCWTHSQIDPIYCKRFRHSWLFRQLCTNTCMCVIGICRSSSNLVSLSDRFTSP